MGRNHFIIGNETLLDLRGDTITADQLVHGVTAHDKSGEQIIGTSWQFPMEPLYYDYNVGYIANGTWKYENPTNTFTDIYQVESGHSYFISLGANVGSRFRAMFTSTDVVGQTRDVAGTQIVNVNSPKAFANAKIIDVASDGYILVAKDNVGKTGVISYVYDMTRGWL